MSSNQLVSHEIRTSLSILKLGIDNLEASCTGKFEKDEAEIIKALKRNVERLERLIKDFISAGKSSSTKYSFPR